MDENGWMSVWAGKGLSQRALDLTLKPLPEPGEDFLGSRFSHGFDLGWYDQYLVVATVYDEPVGTIEVALDGFVEAEVVMPGFQKDSAELLPSDNAVVVLYDYKYEGGIRSWSDDGVVLRFIGTQAYE